MPKEAASMELGELNRHVETLQQLIDGIVESETLRSSIHLVCFLKSADTSQWKKIKEELDKTSKKYSDLMSKLSKSFFEGEQGLRVEDFESVFGDLHGRITGGLKLYADELDEVLKVSESHYKKYSRLLADCSC